MAQNENMKGDQSKSPKDKQNNVTEFSSQQSKNDTSASRMSSGSSTSTGTDFKGQGAGNTGTGSGTGIGGGSGMSAGAGGAATATARSLVDQAKETAGQAYEAVTDKAATKLDEQKSTLTEGLSTVADSVRKVGENLGTAGADSGLAGTAAKYTNTAAQKLEDVAGYFESRNVREMARDLEGYARRNPAIFLGAAFGLGLLAARFLKSTAPRYDSTGAGRSAAATGSGNGVRGITQGKQGSAGNSPDFDRKGM